MQMHSDENRRDQYAVTEILYISFANEILIFYYGDTVLSDYIAFVEQLQRELSFWNILISNTNICK
jgi:hypothetical protein